jgi:predicted dithiol-disulfide oxidoreductase (DUF899 family)
VEAAKPAIPTVGVQRSPDPTIFDRRSQMKSNDVVSHEEWVSARKKLLVREKEMTRQRDQLSQLRRELPWEAVERDYVFEGPNGPATLAELFDGRDQLIVYHMMAVGVGGETPCRICSFWADSFNGITPHLNDRDVTLVVVSRAPLTELQKRAKQAGWTFPMISSEKTDFNLDYHVGFRPEDIENGTTDYNYGDQFQLPDAPGVSVFAKGSGDKVFHTYSTYGRGIDTLNDAYQYLDLVPKGRNEDGLAFPVEWVRYSDEYVA